MINPWMDNHVWALQVGLQNRNEMHSTKRPTFLVQLLQQNLIMMIRCMRIICHFQSSRAEILHTFCLLRFLPDLQDFQRLSETRT